jgi:hypothetical protein
VLLKKNWRSCGKVPPVGLPLVAGAGGNTEGEDAAGFEKRLLKLKKKYVN